MTTFAKNIILKKLLQEKEMYQTTGDLIYVEIDTTIEKVSRILKEKDILSVPVYDRRINEFVGILDSMEILRHIMEADFYKEHKLQFNDESLECFMFSIGNVGEIIQKSTRARRLYRFDSNTCLETVMKVLSECDHRVLVSQMETVESDKTSENSFSTESILSPTKNERRISTMSYHLITQSDIVRFIMRHLKEFGENHLFDRPIEELGMVNPLGSGVFSISTECRAIDGFELMLLRNVQCVAVLDKKDHHIVATLSSSDLKGITADNLRKLNYPVLDFIQEMTGKKASVPVTCTPKSCLSEIIPTILAAKVHRVFIIDSAWNSLGVISMTDIISQVLDTH